MTPLRKTSGSNVSTASSSKPIEKSAAPKPEMSIPSLDLLASPSSHKPQDQMESSPFGGKQPLSNLENTSEQPQVDEQISIHMDDVLSGQLADQISVQQEMIQELKLQGAPQEAAKYEAISEKYQEALDKMETDPQAGLALLATAEAESSTFFDDLRSGAASVAGSVKDAALSFRDSLNMPSHMVGAAARMIPASTLQDMKPGGSVSLKGQIGGSFDGVKVAGEVKMTIEVKKDEKGEKYFLVSQEAKASLGIELAVSEVGLGPGVKIETRCKTASEAIAKAAENSALIAQTTLGAAMPGGSVLMFAALSEIAGDATAIELSGSLAAKMEAKFGGDALTLSNQVEVGEVFRLEMKDGGVDNISLKVGGKIQSQLALGALSGPVGSFSAQQKSEISLEVTMKRSFKKPLSLEGVITDDTPLVGGGKIEASIKVDEKFQAGPVLAKVSGEASISLTDLDVKSLFNGDGSSAWKAMSGPATKVNYSLSTVSNMGVSLDLSKGYGAEFAVEGEYVALQKKEEKSSVQDAKEAMTAGVKSLGEAAAQAPLTMVR